ncbi:MULTISPECIES: GNAT family N-acetyltransferase [Gammaproteobacteria]|uniref:N-acetyltransferase n=1 Tax=Xanthomonas boreopolis TaxID=86183 RepID=A0A919KJ05_9XANT|nr:GNAT family N-acetyltransferase [Pseudomonas sp. Hp2]GHH57884.1 N-acetyltransferase [[Pseudomonas] boreopolis]
MPVVIETERLRLRELEPERDAAAMLVLLNEPGFIRGIADRGVRTVEQAADYLREWLGAQYATYGFGHYALELRDAGTFLGTAGLIQRADLELADIGYALLDEHHGRGYAEEASRAVLAHARDVLGMRGVCGIVWPGNTASVRLLEKLGLRRQGEYKIAAEREPRAYYELIF